MTIPSAFHHLLPSSPPTTPLQHALREAALGVGRTRPNPPVGCVILDDDGTILARGFHARAGDRHAEIVALDALVAARGPGAARGKTVVVTLEPCNHHGRTPPCVDRLLREGVRRVVVGVLDPNRKVNGAGVARLREAGVEVVVAGDGAAEGVDVADAAACRALLRPFWSSVTRGRPWVLLKTASTLDGRVATRTRASRFITGPASRALVHALRDAVDAVVVGAATAIADDPALTVRDAPPRADGTPHRDPLRVLLDRRGEVPITCQLYDPPRGAHGGGAIVFHDPASTPPPVPGVERLALGTALPTVLAELGRRGVLAVLLEAGPRLAARALLDGVVDELWWFHAPVVLGGDGLPAVGALDVDVLARAPRFSVVHRVVVGDDSLTILRG